MKRIIIFYYTLTLIVFFNVPKANAQTSPFTLSPKWYFGNKAGLDFSSGVPVVLTDGKVNGWGQEGSSAICDPSKNLVFYTDGYRLYDQSHSELQTLKGGTSSTQASIIVPDPAHPLKYYLFTANVDDNGSGEKPAAASELGISYYHVEVTGGSISVIAGPVKIASHNEVSEQISSSTDGNGNYWIISHQGGNYSNWSANKFFAWPVTSAGVGTKVESSIAGTTGNNVWQGSIKINKCQTRLAAVFATGAVEVYEWDQLTGKVSRLIQRVILPNDPISPPALYGCEFSPDGNMLYFTSHSVNKLYQMEISSGTIYRDADWQSSNNLTEMGTLQLGPDNKIYVTNGSNGAIPAYIGVVNNPDEAGAACNYDPKGIELNNGTIYPNIHRGIANISWLNPICSMTIADACPGFSFTYSMKNYFNEPVSVVTNSEEWDFGDGNGFQTGLGANPSFSFNGNGSYTVKLRYRDQTCNKSWTLNKDITIGCVLPVEWVEVRAEKVNDRTRVFWSTASEINNSYFIVERSQDGITFNSIGIVEGGGTSNTIRQYFYSDTQPLSGPIFYRIKQVDVNGDYEYSSVVSVFNEVAEIVIAPNPSRNDFKIQHMVKGEGSLVLYDVMGREVYSQSLTAEMVFGSELKEGTYIVRVAYADKVLYKKIIKEL